MHAFAVKINLLAWVPEKNKIGVWPEINGYAMAGLAGDFHHKPHRSQAAGGAM